MNSFCKDYNISIEDFNDKSVLSKSLNPTPPDIWDLATKLDKILPKEYSHTWYGVSYQQDSGGGTSAFAFAFGGGGLRGGKGRTAEIDACAFALAFAPGGGGGGC